MILIIIFHRASLLLQHSFLTTMEIITRTFPTWNNKLIYCAVAVLHPFRNQKFRT